MKLKRRPLTYLEGRERFELSITELQSIALTAWLPTHKTKSPWPYWYFTKAKGMQLPYARLVA